MNRIKPLILSVSFVCSSATYALQIHTAVEDEQITAEISTEETSRITLINDRIKQFFVAQGRLVVEKDETKGDLYITPTNLFQNKDINLFITSEHGKTYSLVLTPNDMPSATVAIKANSHSNQAAKDWEQSNDYEATLTELIKTISRGGIPKGYQFQSMNSASEHRVKNLNLKTVAKFSGNYFTGFIYELKNTSKEVLKLGYEDFKQLKPLALALENHKLYPNMTTKVYMVGQGE